MLSKPDAAMDGDDSCSEVEDVDLREAGGLEHRLELRLVRMHANRLCEIAIRLGRAGDALAEPRQYLERIDVVGALERCPDFGEFEHHHAPTGLEHASHFRKCTV